MAAGDRGGGPTANAIGANSTTRSSPSPSTGKCVLVARAPSFDFHTIRPPVGARSALSSTLAAIGGGRRLTRVDWMIEVVVIACGMMRSMSLSRS
jgi:hypothetical protein